MKMRYLLTTILLCIVSMTSFGKSDDGTRFKVKEKDFADTIKIRFSSGYIYVPVTIGGRTYDFMYDTGAVISQIPDSLADALFAMNIEDTKIIGFDKTIQKIKSGVLSEVTIGKTHFSGMHSISKPAGDETPFVLGGGDLYMNGIIVKIDIKKKILVMTDMKKFFDGEKGCKIDVTGLSLVSKPIIPFSLSDGCTGKALFDTGYNSLMSIERKYYDKSVNGKTGDKFKEQVLWSDFGSIHTGVNGNETPDTVVFMNMREIKMGEATFTNMPVEVSALYNGIGTTILKYGSMIVNPKRYCLVFQPYSEGNTVEIKEKTENIHLISASDGIQVGMINPNCLAYSKGVRKGDYVIEAYGYKLTSFNDVASGKREKTGDDRPIMKFRKPDGKIIEVEMNLDEGK